jgi:hypothetical protein
MGNRISVQFCQRVKHFGSNVISMEKSVVLFNHWQGIDFAEQTLKLEKMKKMGITRIMAILKYGCLVTMV